MNVWNSCQCFLHAVFRASFSFFFFNFSTTRGIIHFQMKEKNKCETQNRQNLLEQFDSSHIEEAEFSKESTFTVRLVTICHIIMQKVNNWIIKADSSYFCRETEEVELLTVNELSAAIGFSTLPAETVSLLSCRRLVRTEMTGETFNENEEETPRVDSWQYFAAQIEWGDPAAIGKGRRERQERRTERSAKWRSRNSHESLMNDWHV